MSKFRFEHITLPQAIEFLAWRKLNAMYQDELFKDTIICQRVVTLAQESAAELVSGEIEGQPLNEEMLMPKEREAAPMGAFFKFTELGQSIAGKVAKYGDGENGPYVTFSPVIIWQSRTGQPECYLTAAVGLSTDLKQKIHAEDAGTLMSISFRDTEPTSKGSSLKKFRVDELNAAEMKELASKAGTKFRDQPYRPATTPAAKAGAIAASEAETDDLPF